MGFSTIGGASTGGSAETPSGGAGSVLRITAAATLTKFKSTMPGW